MERRNVLTGALWLAALFAAPAQASEFMAQLRHASAVAPLRMAERSVTAVLPGRFTGRRADAVLITDDNASLCRGPDYRRCLPLGNLPTKRTVATTVNGESVLLVLDGMSALRVCSVAATNDAATLNCRAVDNNKLKDFNATPYAAGAVLVINGTDGNYACSQEGAWPTCSQPRTPPGAERKLEKQYGKAFRPLDSNTVCRVKHGQINCAAPVKLSELDDDAIAPMMRPALYYYIDVDDDGSQWVDNTLEVVTVNGYYGSAEPTFAYWWSDGYGGGIAQPPRPPNYWQEQCLAICKQQDMDYGDMCRTTMMLLVWNPALAAGYYAACEGGRAAQHLYCRNAICGI